ncbi:hypothetical protein BGZ90_002684 [Linnemannia elongata]|nr:hypothetical protein BGZ90_002684 [Linnemannia elongata]
MVGNRTTHGYPSQIAIGNNRLYTYAYRNIMYTYQGFLTNFPLIPGALSPQPQDKIYDTSTVFYDHSYDSKTNIMYAKDGNLTLIHVRDVSKDSIQFLPSAIYTFIDSPTTVTVGKPQNFTARFPNPIGSFAPLGNGTIGPPNTSQRLFFALVTSYDDMYAFGDDGTGWKTVKALQQHRSSYLRPTNTLSRLVRSTTSSMATHTICPTRTTSNQYPSIVTQRISDRD